MNAANSKVYCIPGEPTMGLGQVQAKGGIRGMDTWSGRQQKGKGTGPLGTRGSIGRKPFPILVGLDSALDSSGVKPEGLESLECICLESNAAGNKILVFV